MLDILSNLLYYTRRGSPEKITGGPPERAEREEMYKIVMVSWGGTKHDFASDLSYDEALQICEDNNWEYSYEPGGYVWDLEIEEDGYYVLAM